MAPIFSRFVNIVWFLLTWFLLVGVVCAGLGGFYLYHHADEGLRAHLQQKLQSQYPDVQVSIQSARLIERRGFEILGLAFSEVDGETPLAQLATIERILVRCSPKLEDILRGEIALSEIVFRNPVIRGSRTQDGGWSLQPLMKLPKFGDHHPPRLRIENGVVEIVDTTVQPSRLLILRNLNAVVTPSQRESPDQCPPAKFVANFTSDYAHQVTLSGKINPCRQEWQFAGETKGLTVSPSLIQSLPVELAGLMGTVSGLQTQMQLKFGVSHVAERQPATQYMVQGRASRGRIDDPRLPSPITGLSADLAWNNSGIALDNVKGRIGGAPIELSYRRDSQRELIKGTVRGVQVDEQAARGLSGRLQELWESFRPRGSLSATFALNRLPGGTVWRPDLVVECHHMDFQWSKVPYPLHAQTGTIAYQDNLLSVELRSTDSDRPTHVQAQVTRPGKAWTGWAMVSAHAPLKIDSDLINATSPRTQQILDDFNLRGDVVGTLRLERDQANQKPHHRMSVQLSNGEVQHAKFPYPIRHLTGRVERDGEHWKFLDFVGHNDNGVITCDGQLGPTESSRQLRLHFIGTSIPLEAELYEALSPGTQLVWDQLQPQGVLDHVAVTYLFDTVEHTKDLDVTLRNDPHTSRKQGQPLSIHAAAFPYTISDVVGTIRYRNGEIKMQRLRGRNGDVTVAAAGRARMVDDHWELNFEQLAADRLVPKSDLLRALPHSIRRFVERTQFAGPVAVQGRLTLAGRMGERSKPRATWDLEVDFENGSMVLTWPVTQVSGQVHLRGGADRDSFETAGELICDSAMWRGAQVTDVTGPLWMDGSRLLVGQWAKPQNAAGLQKPSLAGKVFGGAFELDAQLLDHQFDLQTRFVNIDVGHVARDVAKRPYNIRGTMSGGLALSGQPNGVHTLRGNGGATIQDTDLYELPVMLSMLNTLSTGSTDNTAFTSSDMVFNVKGNRIYFEQLDLKGPALTLKGVGDAGFDRDLNLDFYSIVGREESYIPAVRSFLGLASRRFMRVHVEGTMDEPRVMREVLPGVNQTLQQLFPEVAEEDSEGTRR